MLSRIPRLLRVESLSPHPQARTSVAPAHPVTASDRRMAAIDIIKGAACLLIVAHHLAVYGPMSDSAGVLMPWAIGWLYDYGRWVVQVFLVIGGYLAAASLASSSAQALPLRQGAAALIWRRYCRLVLPYGVAVVASVAIAALVRPWFSYPSVPEAPTLAQALAHALFLQDIFGFKALSAGLWYVAIDFQLYALSVLVFGAAAGAAHRWPRITVLRGDWAMLAIGLASLLVFNRNTALDATAFYFVGAYVLGMLAYWAAPETRPHDPVAWRRPNWFWLTVLVAVGTAALLVEFRGRLALAGGVALALVALRQVFQGPARAADGSQRKPLGHTLAHATAQLLARVGVISYTVFLIHFPVCLLVNAVMANVLPTGAWANLFGLAAAMALSLVAGSVLFRWAELASGALRSRRSSTALPA